MIWSRSAFWLGQPRPGAAEKLEAIIRHEIVPAMRGFDDLVGSSFLWPKEHEDGAPPIYFQSILSFANREALDRLGASPERAALRPKVLAALELFDGTIGHTNFETL